MLLERSTAKRIDGINLTNYLHASPRKDQGHPHHMDLRLQRIPQRHSWEVELHKLENMVLRNEISHCGLIASD
jgi:hypothetical protein